MTTVSEEMKRLGFKTVHSGGFSHWAITDGRIRLTVGDQHDAHAPTRWGQIAWWRMFDGRQRIPMVEWQMSIDPFIEEFAGGLRDGLPLGEMATRLG